MAGIARRYLQMRQRLSAWLPSGLFADPALEILLDLFVAEKSGRAISVSSACIASGVSHSTANAWIVRLEKAGLVSRTRDRSDGRRTFLVLERGASEAIGGWLAEMER